ncbi:VCBS repeat protein [Haloactinopolyspora alba]|uniref:VCBS repeat protein n=1 Tax=Haloactinopolyspora alba TaxID=648780 RepID=A0A2P8E0Z9_9ACTN|nr:VCBS repeat protein [Haloactinopolyspora alba]
MVRTRKLEVEPFELAALTWKGDAEITAWVRTRSEGTWSSWYELPGGADHAPNHTPDQGAGNASGPTASGPTTPGTTEPGTRHGTDPLIVERSDAVQVRVDAPDGAVPDSLRLDLVAPGDDPASVSDAPTASTQEAAQGAAVAGARVPRPRIRSRAAWGADESLRGDPPDYGEIRGAFVHHTVNTSRYSRSRVPRIIRSIYRYHVQSRGWKDIGYNFLVDRFGRIWEGRYGGIGRPVIGAHTYRYNDQAFGMAAIGTYTGTVPTMRMRRAYQELFGWKFAVHRVDPRRRVRYEQGRLPAIAGHRDVSATACPGHELYRRLDQIRRGTIAAMELVPGRDLNVNWRPELLATTRAGRLYLAKGNGDGYAAPRRAGSGWHRMDGLATPGDWNGDGIDDLVARRKSDGSLWLYPSADNGNLGSKRQIGWGWQGINAIVGAGDFDGNGRPDLLARRRSDGSLWLYPRRANGITFAQPRRVGTGWAGMSAIMVVGDWNGDRIPDVVARRRSDGSLWLYRGRGDGAFRPARLIGSTGWDRYQLVAAGDVDDDGRADLVGRRGDELALFRGDGRGGFINKQRLAGRWGGYNRIV